MADGIELAFRVPGHEHIDVWVSLEDALALAQDEFLYGQMFLLPFDDPDNSQVTHRRVPPSNVLLSERDLRRIMEMPVRD